LAALELARRRGRVTNGDLQERFAYHPETLRQDLAALVRMCYLDKNGQAKGTFYTKTE
jgi:DeoR/GlpR family transcriptional regulator of sugar metabolism